MNTLLTVGREHDWLRRMTGEWKLMQEYFCFPDEPLVSFGSESIRLIGGRWIMAQAEIGRYTRTSTLDFDPVKRLFVGTAFDSLSNHLWVHEATLDELGNTLTLETLGPEYPIGDEPFFPIKETTVFQNQNRRFSQMSILRESGEWQILIETHALRVN